ncbi:hypothetical protein CsatA_021377 [Cannabis sativa]
MVIGNITDVTGRKITPHTTLHGFTEEIRAVEKEYELYDSVKEYIFFDSGYATEKVNEQFAVEAWSGKPCVSGTYEL